MSLTQVLLEAQSPDQQLRTAASLRLDAFCQESPSQFLLDIAHELADEAKPKNARLLAALTVKNTLRNATHRDQFAGIWEVVGPEFKVRIRSDTLSTLASADKDVRAAAGQAVAAIATLDIPKNDWPDILTVLVTNAGNTNPAYKQASIITLGYLCEELDPANLTKPQTDQILTAIAGNLSSDLVDLEIKLDAIKSLTYALRFAKANFENDQERQYLIGLLCASAQHRDARLRLNAFQTLCDVVLLYYDYIGPNLPEIWTVTCTAITTDEERIGVLALEVWNSIGDIEKDRQQSSSQPYHSYISKAAGTLLPLLLAGVVKYTPGDEDEWTIRKSASTNLTLLALLTGDIVVDPCIEFVSRHISAPEWQLRNSAALVFGSILEGPTPQKMSHLVTSGVDAMLTLMHDTSVTVRITAAWVLGRLSDVHFSIVVQPTIFPRLVTALLSSLQDSPKVAVHACWGFITLIDHGAVFNAQEFEAVLNAVMAAAQGHSIQDQSQDLEPAAYSSACTLIEKASSDCIPLIQKRIPVFLGILKNSLHKPHMENVQSFICSTLQSTCVKLPSTSFSPELIATIVTTILELFKSRQTVVEEGIQALGALAQTVDNAFEPHLLAFGPFLVWALKKQDEVSVCKAGTMCVGDIARALNDKITPFLPDLIPLLLTNLEKADISTDIKIQSIASLADLASNSRGAFVQYLQSVLHFVDQAAEASATPVKEAENPDLWEYLIELREAILQFYVGLLQGLGEAKQQDQVLGYVPKIVDFALFATQEVLRPTQDMHVNALGLLGDIAVAFGDRVKSVVTANQVLQYVQRWANSPSPRVHEVAIWAQSAILGNKS